MSQETVQGGRRNICVSSSYFGECMFCPVFDVWLSSSDSGIRVVSPDIWG